MITLPGVFIVGVIVLHSIIKKRKEILYSIFLALVFGALLKYAGNGDAPDIESMAVASASVFYPHLLPLLLLFVNKGLLSFISGVLLGAGIGSMVRNREKRIEKEYGEVKRKVFHMGAGIFIFLVAYFLGRNAGIVAISLSALISFLLPRLKLPFKKTIDEMVEVRKERPAEGAFNFCIGSLIPLLIGQPWIVLVLGIGDGLSTLVGKFFGRIPIYRDRSFEGTFAGFLATFIIARFFYPQPIIPAILYAIADIFSPVDDNLTIPILLSLLYLKPLT